MLRNLLKPSISKNSAQDPLQFLPNIVTEFREATACNEPCRTVFVLNEIGLSWGTEAAHKKRTAVLALVEALEARGAIIDAIGIQAHLSAKPDVLPDPAALRDFLLQAEKLGLTVHVSELDLDWMRDNAPENFNDAAHGEILSDFVEVMLSSPVVTRIGFCGLSDIDSGLVYDCAEITRKEQTTNWEEAMRLCSGSQRPTLYAARVVGGYEDKQLSVELLAKKPVMSALERAIRDASRLR